jgi:hypothetical protein
MLLAIIKQDFSPRSSRQHLVPTKTMNRSTLLGMDRAIPEFEKMHNNIHFSHFDYLVGALLGLRRNAFHSSHRPHQPPPTVFLIDNPVKSCKNGKHVTNMACDETGIPQIIYVDCVVKNKESGKRTRAADLETVNSPLYKRSKLASLPSFPVVPAGRPMPPPPPLFVASLAKVAAMPLRS